MAVKVRAARTAPTVGPVNPAPSVNRMDRFLKAAAVENPAGYEAGQKEKKKKQVDIGSVGTLKPFIDRVNAGYILMIMDTHGIVEKIK